ncbi:MAG TPA: nucleoside triphosphate pyrophosphatase [Solirubrobacteraceae bacterium]|nr:nucleoside triphosphate pyrophosphatase [Solirubrobacteraceae bacterium]
MSATGGRPMILASGSPQRRAILGQLGVDFTVVVSGAEELSTGRPEEVAVENARRKARAAAEQAAGGETVLGVDTLVALGERIYGKPADRGEAAEALRALAGRSHRVLSGICLIDDGGERTVSALTRVSIRPLGDKEIDWYLDTGEWQGRAGGYAIQGRGAALVRSIEGDYLNVVGLPVATLLDLLPSLLFTAI